ncbi:hypothetical protein ACLB2K_032364 [Fragaria x ananassa]
MARISLCNQLIPSLLVPMKQRSHYQLMGVFGLTRGRRFSASSSPKISMSLKAGIVGLPNVGKSTLFNAVVENGKAQAANFPFCTIEPNVGIVAVPDPRLNVLSDLSKSQRVVPASLELVDIAGLVKGASQGEGLGNTFLSNIREVDSILQISLLLRKCKSLSSQLGRSSSYSSLRSKSTREDLYDGIHENHQQITIFVGSTRKRYVISSKYLNHPLLNALIDSKQKNNNRGDDQDHEDILVKCEVILFDHLLWMLENGDPSFDGTSESLEELAALYVF